MQVSLMSSLAVAALIHSSEVLGVPQQRPATEVAVEEAIEDSTAECIPYDYNVVDSNLSSFPEIWETANIVEGDNEAIAAWDAMRNGVPDVEVKGTQSGDITSALASYPDEDPDCWWTYSECVTAKHTGVPNDVATVPEPKTLGYGFDDGPNCSHNAFYDFLAMQNQLATMYFVGSNVMNWPKEAQRAVTDGHEICLHGWSHKYMTSLSNEEAFAELYYARKAVKLVTGLTPTCWRPPFGDVDDRIRYIANSLNLITILWKHDTFDWKAGQEGTTEADIDKNYEDIIALAQGGAFDEEGAIVLMHELNNFTMSEAIKYYPQMKSAFEHILPVGVALNVTQPYSETDRTEPTFNQYTTEHESPLNSRSNGGRDLSSNGISGRALPLRGPIQRLSNNAPSLNRHLKRHNMKNMADVVWVVCMGLSVALLVLRVM